MYQDETLVLLYNKSNTLVDIPTVSQALAFIGYTNKATRHIVNKRNADFCDYYLHYLSHFSHTISST